MSIVVLLPGCAGSATSTSNAPVAAEQKSPDAEFEWGMKRLERALRLSRPSTSDGMYTERSMDYELIAPNGETDYYTAKVTITTQTEFIHGKRESNKKTDEKKAESQQEPGYEDLLADDSEKVDTAAGVPEAGPEAPKAFAAAVEPRSIANESEFELAYLEEKWQLQTKPEHKYEQLWFEYAFP